MGNGYIEYNIINQGAHDHSLGVVVVAIRPLILVVAIPQLQLDLVRILSLPLAMHCSARPSGSVNFILNTG